MPFVSRQQADPKVRAKHERQHKRALRQALRTPGLTEAQRAAIQAELAQVGLPKTYDADRAPKAGAIHLEPLSAPQPQTARPSAMELGTLKRTDLMAMAKRLGLPASGTKAALIARIQAK